jgi:sulfate permease, SulP family
VGPARGAAADLTAKVLSAQRLRHALPLRGLDAGAPRRGATLRNDTVAGIIGAIGSVPDGMAAAVVAGVNPIHGLYASAIGPLVGGLLTSSALMVVTTTSAAALAAGSGLDQVSKDERTPALFLLVVLVGLLQIGAGLLRLGRLTHFVSHSVMTGFLTGVATLIVLGQFGNLTGTQPAGTTSLQQALDVVAHPGRIDAPSIGLGLVAIVLIVAPYPGALRKVAPLLALALPSLAVAAFTFNDVATVRDVGAIPRGLPLPALPRTDLLSVQLLTTAVAVAAIVLVQGAGVAQSVASAGASPARPSRDFIAEGGANVAVGFFRGLPVGGSVGQSALVSSAGARTRAAAVLSGVAMLLVLAVFAPLVEFVAMPALAGLLVVAGVNTIRADEVLVLWRTGTMSRLAVVSTFVATLFLPIQLAVGLGILLSMVLYLNQASTDVSLVELVEVAGGNLEERRPPSHLASGRAVVLEVYGSLFFAGARTFARLLPSPEGAESPVVILRIRGRTKVGATFVDVLDRYATRMNAVAGRLYLTGVDPHVQKQITRSGKLDLEGPVSLYGATSIVGGSTRRALADAQVWLSTQTPPDLGPNEGANDGSKRNGRE